MECFLPCFLRRLFFLQPKLFATFRAKAGCIGYDGIAYGAIQMKGLIQVKKRFMGKDCAAVRTVAFFCRADSAADAADTGLFHDIRPEAEAFHAFCAKLMFCHRGHLPS